MIQWLSIMTRNEHSLLSEMTDYAPNIYELTRDLARIAKQIKHDTKEDINAPKPVLEAVKKIYQATIS
jgi:hypothetical protein